jgi:hypothetical protein
MKILVGTATASHASYDAMFATMASAMEHARDYTKFFALEEGEVVSIGFDGLDFGFEEWGEDFFMEAERQKLDK